MEPIDDLPRAQLLALLRVYARNWLAHDGSWFLAAEESLGLEQAIALDAQAWARFAPAEARRIMREFGIPEWGGLEALEKALSYRLYAAVNRQSVEWTPTGGLLFRMLECRVQRTRREKGLPPFPCKEVGLVEFTRFAEAVDPRIRTRCVSCPPDADAEAACAWEFTLDSCTARQ